MTLLKLFPDAPALPRWERWKMPESYTAYVMVADQQKVCADCGGAIESGAYYWHCREQRQSIHENCIAPDPVPDVQGV